MALSFINAGILSSKILPMVGALALAYGGLVQLLAGMWAFIKNDTFAAVALSSYGGFWISFYLLQSTFLKQIPVANQGPRSPCTCSCGLRSRSTCGSPRRG